MDAFKHCMNLLGQNACPPNCRGLISALLAGAMLSGCASLPELEALSTPINETARQSVVAGHYPLTTDNTQITFAAGPTPVGVVNGEFTSFTGHLTVIDADQGNVELKATLDVASIEGPDNMTRNMLLEEDWFDVAQFPEARFEGRMIGWEVDGAAFVNGAMTIRDVSREEAFTVVLTCEGITDCPDVQIGFEGQLRLDRTNYDMTAFRTFVGPHVDITVKGTVSAPES